MNRVNGTYGCESQDLLAKYIKTELGFPGILVLVERRDFRPNHSALASKYASEPIVLLKNTNNPLPPGNKTSISSFGTYAATRYVGANTALAVYDGEPPTMEGHMAAETSSGMQGSGTYLTETTLDVADGSDACVVFLNAWGGEVADRTELYNEGQDALVSRMAANRDNIANTIGPRLLDDWIEHENVTGVLYAGALGQESGDAIDDVLFGSANPSGRLVHTIAMNENDYNSDTIISDSELQLNFTDGNYIDYKYFDQYNITPRFEYSFGLSCTIFNHSSTVSVESRNLKSGYAAGDKAVDGREDLWDIFATAKTSIAITGTMAGAEAVQLYVSFPAAAGEPVRQLRGFSKTTFQPGQSVDVTFDLHRRDLSVWSVAGQESEVVKGEYVFYVRASSRDFKAKATLAVS